MLHEDGYQADIQCINSYLPEALLPSEYGSGLLIVGSIGSSHQMSTVAEGSRNTENTWGIPHDDEV